jgi:glycolate oxidase iron-sulfur subunit
MKSVADGDLPLSDIFVEEMDFCLDCQACETACPAGVKYGELVEAARSDIAVQRRESWPRRTAKKFFLGWLLPKRQRLHNLAGIMRWIDRTGIREALRKSGLLALISKRLHSLEGLMPLISGAYSSNLLPDVFPPHGTQRFNVGFLTGCIMDVAFSDVNMDTVEVLRHHGCQVIVPRTQECCGSLHAHNGETAIAKELAAVNLAAFDDDSLDAVIMNSSGCGAFMKEYGHLFADSPQLAEKAQRLSRKVKDITEFLDETGFFPATTAPNVIAGKRISYHDACHLVHTQKISAQPRRLIQSVPGIEFREIQESTWCCGSAGIYNIVRHDDSMKLLDRKIANIRSADPDILVTGNPGCLLQIQHGLREGGRTITVMHTATFLRHACAL